MDHYLRGGTHARFKAACGPDGQSLDGGEAEKAASAVLTTGTEAFNNTYLGLLKIEVRHRGRLEEVDVLRSTTAYPDAQTALTQMERLIRILLDALGVEDPERN